MTDPIADYLTRLRNAIKAKHRVVEIPSSKIKKAITRILHEQGYILSYKNIEDGGIETIKIALKYDHISGTPAISKLGRISRPGLRRYAGFDEIPRIINGLGIAVVSTSRGVFTDKDARKQKIGGEVICYVY